MIDFDLVINQFLYVFLLGFGSGLLVGFFCIVIRWIINTFVNIIKKG